MEKRRAIIAGRPALAGRHFLASKVGAGSVAGAVIAALIVGPGLSQSVRMSWQQRVLARKQQRLESLYRLLEAERRRLTSDPVYVEGLIRSTFKVAKPNEIVLPLEPSENR